MFCIQLYQIYALKYFLLSMSYHFTDATVGNTKVFLILMNYNLSILSFVLLVLYLKN